MRIAANIFNEVGKMSDHPIDGGIVEQIGIIFKSAFIYTIGIGTHFYGEIEFCRCCVHLVGGELQFRNGNPRARWILQSEHNLKKRGMADVAFNIQGI